MNCWKCQKAIFDAPSLKIGFRAECPHCGADLHTCTNCKYYAPGKPNDCLIPGTEWIKDREARNFCEDFSIKAPSPHGNEFRERSKDNFKSLFKDD